MWPLLRLCAGSNYPTLNSHSCMRHSLQPKYPKHHVAEQPRFSRLFGCSASPCEPQTGPGNPSTGWGGGGRASSCLADTQIWGVGSLSVHGRENKGREGYTTLLRTDCKELSLSPARGTQHPKLLLQGCDTLWLPQSEGRSPVLLREHGIRARDTFWH